MGKPKTIKVKSKYDGRLVDMLEEIEDMEVRLSMFNYSYGDKPKWSIETTRKLKNGKIKTELESNNLQELLEEFLRV